MSLEIVKVTKHAIKQYRERFKVPYPDHAIEASIRELLNGAPEWELKKKHYQTLQAMNHRDHARYFRAYNHIFVIANGVVLTVHKGTAKRWRPMKK